MQLFVIQNLSMEVLKPFRLWEKKKNMGNGITLTVIFLLP